MTDPVWTPSEERRQAAHLTAFMAAVSDATGQSLANYPDLHAWSVEERSEFWQQLWSFAGITASVTSEQVLVDGDRMPGAKWFVDAKLNFAENLLRKRGPQAAIIFRDEAGHREELSWDQLHRRVACCGGRLTRLGRRAGGSRRRFFAQPPGGR